jgi:hypothetical protein
MDRFLQTFETWLEAPLPAGSTIDAIDEFHAELVQWDAFVADLVVPHSRGSDAVRPVYDYGGPMLRLRCRIRWYQQLHADATGKLSSYLRYLDLIADTFSAMSDARGWNADD